ncbi:MAG: decarboxylase [Phycisphaerales bacterium]|nr:decarboxylase [Phycisphaerales bacterium]
MQMTDDLYTLEQFNQISPAEARAALMECCRSARWVEQMLVRRPYAQFDDLLIAADEAFANLEPVDWQEAFARPEPLEEDELPIAATEQMKATNACLRTMISDAI